MTNNVTKPPLYKVVDKNNIELPNHYSGRYRTKEEADRLIERLNKNGEYKPYRSVPVS